MGTLYARRENTTDSTTLDMLRSNSKWVVGKDVQLYYDDKATRPAARYPWYYSNKPTRRNRYVMHNCARYRLVWLDKD